MNNEVKAKYQNAYAKGEKGFKDYSKTPEWMTNAWRLLSGSKNAEPKDQAGVPPKAPKSNKD